MQPLPTIAVVISKYFLPFPYLVCLLLDKKVSQHFKVNQQKPGHGCEPTWNKVFHDTTWEIWYSVLHVGLFEVTWNKLSLFMSRMGCPSKYLTSQALHRKIINSPAKQWKWNSKPKPFLCFIDYS